MFIDRGADVNAGDSMHDADIFNDTKQQGGGVDASDGPRKCVPRHRFYYSSAR